MNVTPNRPLLGLRPPSYVEVLPEHCRCRWVNRSDNSGWELRAVESNCIRHGEFSPKVTKYNKAGTAAEQEFRRLICEIIDLTGKDPYGFTSNPGGRGESAKYHFADSTVCLGLAEATRYATELYARAVAGKKDA